MAKPELWIIAGPNGAGKTTFVSRVGSRLGVPENALINPDAITLDYLKAKGVNSWEDAPPDVLRETFIQAANDAQALLETRITEGKAAVIESVLSTDKYCQLVDRVIEMGGTFHFIYVALESPDHSKKRVALRVERGGHGVPEDKLASRWAKSLEFLPWFAVRATSFWLFDNSDSSRHLGEVLLASGTQRKLHLHGVPSPAMRPLVAEFISRFTKLDTEDRWQFDLGEAYEL